MKAVVRGALRLWSRRSPVKLGAGLVLALSLVLVALPVLASPAGAADPGQAQEAADAVELVDTEGVRGNMTLPTTGLYGAELAWTSSDPDVITTTGEVTRPAHGEEPVPVDLTVTSTLDGDTGQRTIPVTVLPAPAPLDPEAYVFPYFTGESRPDDEQIRISASKGNDPTAWDELNDGNPILQSTLSEQGLRDPFLIRSHEGDKFWLLATDLRIYGGNNFSEAQESGSKHLMVWESTDLVTWSEQRMVKVSSDLAGNTWAPEAFYDEASGEYVVYWASNLYPDANVAARDYRTTYNRMMYATTRDFRTFSEARPWVDVKRGTGRGMIDATVVRDGDTFYRFIKDEASMTVRQERSTDLTAVVTGALPTSDSPAGGWQLVQERIGSGEPNPWGGTFEQGEGPTVFRDNEVPGRWWMLIDQPSYHGGQGYLAFRTDDIASGDWTSVPGADLPSRPRHGTVIPISRAELRVLRAELQPDLLAESAAPVSVTTREGEPPALPETVPVTYADGSTRQTAVDWDAVSPDQYADWGSFEVGGTVPSQDVAVTATVTVTDAADPVVTLATVPGAPDGKDGWFTDPPDVLAEATDEESGVDLVELSLDGSAWEAGPDGGSVTRPVPEGEHEVRARAHDVSGNTAYTEPLAVKVDSHAPVSRARWDPAARSLTLRAADETSGVEVVEYRVGDGDWEVYESPITFGDVARTVRYRAVDVAGNVELTNSVNVPRAERDASTTTATLSKVRVQRGRSVAARVVVVGDGGLVPTGVVRVLVGGDIEVGRGTLQDGTVSVPIDTRTLGVGRWRLQVVYDGDADHTPSSDRVVLTVVRRTR